MPADRKITHEIFVAEILHQKDETNITRITVGVNLTKVPGEATTPTEDLTTAKTIYNSILSIKKCKIYVRLPCQFLLEQSHGWIYMKLPLEIIPD